MKTYVCLILVIYGFSFSAFGSTTCYDPTGSISVPGRNGGLSKSQIRTVRDGRLVYRGAQVETFYLGKNRWGNQVYSASIWYLGAPLIEDVQLTCIDSNREVAD